MDDLSGSVLDDPETDVATLALVELTRAFLYAYGNPGSLSEARLVGLMPLFEVLLDQPEPLATNDVRALMTYSLSVFEPGSPVRMQVEATLSRRSRTMFISMADSLVAQGQTTGIARAVLRVLERRSLSIPEPLRERVAASRDEQQLLRWLDRAVTAASVDDVLGEAGE